MSVYIGKERSSLKPSDSPHVRSKKELKFSYSTAEYDSYAKNGFVPPELWNRTDFFEQRFIAQADPDKGPVKVRINNIVRLKAPDYFDNDKEKEFIYWNSDWEAKDWLGREIFVRGHIDGQYYEQTRRLTVGEIDRETGVQETYYVKGVPRLTYSIPFNKKNVESILNNKHPFGESSINITNVDSVVLYGKFGYDFKAASQGFRTAGYSIEISRATKRLKKQYRTIWQLKNQRSF